AAPRAQLSAVVTGDAEWRIIPLGRLLVPFQLVFPRQGEPGLIARLVRKVGTARALFRHRGGPHMRNSFAPRRIFALALLVSAGVTGAHSDEPPVYALVNARIVPVSGAPIERGAVVMRNGIIEAVGAGAMVPGDARVIDASKMTVYPGLIDALSDAALEELRP